MAPGITYSEKYYDDKYEYRHVILPVAMGQNLPKAHMLTETEWRNIGVHQSPGWVHYMTHNPEPHILLFRRPLSVQPNSNGSGPDCDENGELLLPPGKSVKHVGHM